MRRFVIPALSLLLFVVTVAFGLYAWFHWRENQIVELLWLWGQHLELSPGQLMVNCFAVGAGVGITASILTFGASAVRWRETNEKLRGDQRRLAAANRALEAALPVLREKYDRAIGALDPSIHALHEPIGGADTDDQPLPRLTLDMDTVPAAEAALEPEGETVSVGEIAREEAAARRPRV